MSSVLAASGLLLADDAPAPKAVTVIPAPDDYGEAFKIPKDELELLLKPLTADELIVEADAWLDMLKSKVKEISDEEIKVKHANREIAKAEEKADAAAEKKAEAESVAEAKKEEAANVSETATAAPAAKDAHVEAEAADKEAEQAKAQEAAAKKEAEAQAEKKKDKLVTVITKREDQQKIIDRFNIVLAALTRKGGDAKPYETYVNAVSGIKIDVSDASAVWVSIWGWATSEEGGLRLAKNIGLFLVTLFAFWILSRITGRAVRRGVKMMRGASDLFRDFLVNSARRSVLIVGLIVALGQLEVEISPLLAAIGAAGFVVAFALQGTLSNFASGILILVYRPFDVGDFVEVAGVNGTVESMTLMTTTIKSADNKRVVVPNNSIWGNVITNVTGNSTRRVDMVFGIGYGDDGDKAKGILEKILTDHPLVLKDPAPVVRMHELADSSVNFVCRPWSLTSDYWTVYWDVTREVKKRFDAESVSIPFPQRDIHVYHETAVPAADK
ncbi:MAG: mechanosensitive ion channel family protein [Phycisphaerales bacterium]|nr:mechanosensitive ion channel family protein [Phycisphaerales bacterium]MCB9855451.1 mechanosensitive ion channel family protein [Phycisphaerales bacterium]MCB9864227.1 mechanosensitive ion channel family protein [Phycisphaerales bacterium]